MAEREVDTFKVNFDESLHKYKDDKDKKEKQITLMKEQSTIIQK